MLKVISLLKHEEDMSLAAAADPACQQARYVMGECYRKLGNSRLARANLQAACDLLEDDDRPHYALSLLDVGRDLEGAIRHLEDAIDRHPKNPQYFLNRGMVLEQAQRLDEAKADYERALELEPGHPRVGDVVGDGAHQVPPCQHGRQIVAQHRGGKTHAVVGGRAFARRPVGKPPLVLHQAGAGPSQSRSIPFDQIFS